MIDQEDLMCLFAQLGLFVFYPISKITDICMQTFSTEYEQSEEAKWLKKKPCLFPDSTLKTLRLLSLKAHFGRGIS